MMLHSNYFYARLILLLLLCSLLGQVQAQSIRINEVVASNASIITDEDGEFSDWIELYNTSPSPVNLAGYGLSDNLSQPFKWTFPEVTIEPGEFLVVWASSKNRKPVPGEWSNGLMREVFLDIPGTSVSNLISHPSFPDNPSSQNLVRRSFEAPTNIADNYGQRMHGFIKPPLTGSYTFWISSDDNGQLFLSSNDDPENVVKIAEVPGWANPREWEKYPAQKSTTIPLQAGQYYYIAALMKEGQGGDNLAVRWQLPDGTINQPIAGEYIFWNGPGELHTNFGISSTGEAIILTHPDGTLIDQAEAVVIPTNTSYGRKPDGTGNWYFFNQPTPGSTNSTSTGYEAILSAPVFSHGGGFYNTTFDLSITADPEVTILYTLDGSEPDEANLAGTTYTYKNQYPHFPGNPFGPLLVAPINSYSYSSPISITDRSPLANRIAGRSSTYDQSPWYAPSFPIFKGTVVRAKAIKDGNIASETITHTYFISPLGQARYSLPVVSLTLPENQLFGYEEGIYTPGKAFDDWRTQNPGGEANGGVPANYQFSGDAFEYLGHVQVFDSQHGTILDQRMGMRIHGGYSRSFPTKSLRLYARGEYGNSHFEYPLFAERSSTAYKRILLRNSGNDWDHTYFRDAAIQAIAQPLKIDRQAYRPTVLFLNGEYWGLINARERYDKHYLNRMYGVDAENLDILEANAVVDEGDADHYNETINYILDNNVVQDAHYEYIKTRIDIENYIDYQIIQIFARNTDWPGNNIKYWRLKTNSFQPNAPHGHDGRWRWLLYDTDFGFGIWSNTFTHNTLAFAAQANGPSWPNPPWSTLLFRELLRNEQFKNAFISRFNDMLNSAFLPSRTTAIVNEMKKAYEPEIAEHIARWKVPSSTSAWNNNVNVMVNFAQERPAHQRQHIRSFFSLGTDINLTVDVSNPQHGHVRINTIEIKSTTAGISQNPYPFSGMYFRSIPIELEAIPAPGYKFAGWQGIANGNTQKIQLTPEGNISLIANFVAGETTQLLHYWNFNNASELLTPTYTMGDGSITVAVASGTEVLEGSGQGFASENARLGDNTGTHLRINNPIGTSVLFALPTTGYKEVILQYETRRSGQGAGIQNIEYTTDGHTFSHFETITVVDGNPVLYSFDFSDIEPVANNPDFAVRISFEQGLGGIAGNNRFDNITVDGTALEGTNIPPIVAQPIGLVTLIEGGAEHRIDLSAIFTDVDNDLLTITASTNLTDFLSLQHTGNNLTLVPTKRGDAIVTLIADDGHSVPVAHEFRVLIYPKPIVLKDEGFTFANWDSELPERTYPEHSLFLQSDTNDPTVDTPLQYPYFVAHDDYHADDAGTIGFPYKSTGRTRINGLDNNGISFINTGRGRDVGGLLVAINTEGLSAVKADWLCGTILQNSRVYGISLQYRIGIQDNFTTLASQNYVTGVDGHTHSFTDVQLPETLLGQPYVQLLWRYHHMSVTSGSRAQLRLDDVVIEGTAAIVSVDNLVAAEQRSIFPNPVSGEATIEFTLLRESDVKVTLTDMMGHSSVILADGFLTQGKHERILDTSLLSPGNYIITIQTHSGVSHHKVAKY
ncbi:MAG: CotH kinase family protein [Cyclobacteriaceae bacterium]|nr:CotH kinase family protein [Cyclobacteriaceae bacterium]